MALTTVLRTSVLHCDVTRLSLASVRMCDCKRLSAHNFVDFCLQTTPTTSEVVCDVDHRHDVRRPVSHARRYAVVQSPFNVVEVDLSLWATTTVAVQSPRDLFVASQ